MHALPRIGLLLLLGFSMVLAGCSDGGDGGNGGAENNNSFADNGSSASSSSSSSGDSLNTSSSSSSSGGSSSSSSGTGFDGGSSSSSSGSTSGGSALSDEFSGPDMDLLVNNAGDWQVLNPEKADAIDIGVTVNGKLTVLAQSIEPAAVNAAWFENNFGTLVYKEVSGNFAVTTSLRVIDRDTPVVTNKRQHRHLPP